MNEGLHFKVLEYRSKHNLEDVLESFTSTIRMDGFVIGDIQYSTSIDGMGTSYSALITYYADIHGGR